MSWIKNFVLVVMVSSVTFKILDVAFGAVMPGEYIVTSLERGVNRSIILREFNPNQSASIAPSNFYMKNVDSLEQRNYPVTIDANGFIENGNIIQPNPDLRIIFFGGSTTETLFVDEQNRFPSIIERSLRNAMNQKVVVHNAGVSGNNSMHSNLALIAKGIPLDPDFVALMHNINDFSLLSKTESYWVSPISRALISKNFSPFFTTEDSARSLTFKTLKKIKNFLFPNLYEYLAPRLLSKLKLHKDDFKEFRLESSVVDTEVEKQFRASLITFIKLAETWDIKPILMTQFNRVKIDDPIFQRFYQSIPEGSDMSAEKFIQTYQKFNDITREVARQRNIPLIDLELLVPSSKEYIYDTVHLNDEGSKYVAKIISDQIIKIISSDI